MRQENDTLTYDLLGDTCDLAGPIVTPPPKVKKTPSQRAEAYRARHGVRPVTLNLPCDLVDQLETYVSARGLKKNDVIAKLVRSQLLRKR